jgi:LPXTG-site transpeptidase (sortase) family protein
VVVALVVIAVGVFLLRSKPAPPPVSLVPTPIVSPIFPSLPPGRAGYRVRSKELGIDLPIAEGDGWTVAYNRAAHYPGMSWPGEKNRSMIYSHALPGMFGPLSHATVGQHVDIERPGQPTLHYVIRDFHPKWSPGDLTYTKPTDHEELVLLTCTTYSANDPRVLAVAELTN